MEKVLQFVIEDLEKQGVQVLSSLGKALSGLSCLAKIPANAEEVGDIGSAIVEEICRVLLEDRIRSLKREREAFSRFPLTPECCPAAILLGDGLTVANCLEEDGTCSAGVLARDYDKGLGHLIQLAENELNPIKESFEDMMIKMASDLGIDITIMKRSH